MRRSMIAILGVAMAMAATAHAQSGGGAFGEPKRAGTLFGHTPTEAQRRAPSGAMGVAPPEPYRPRTPQTYPQSPGSATAGGGFKPYKPPEPFKGASVYGSSASVYQQPAKPKPRSSF